MKKLLMMIGAAAIAVGATLPAWAAIDRTWVGGTGTADSPRDINADARHGQSQQSGPAWLAVWQKDDVFTAV